MVLQCVTYFFKCDIFQSIESFHLFWVCACKFPTGGFRCLILLVFFLYFFDCIEFIVVVYGPLAFGGWTRACSSPKAAKFYWLLPLSYCMLLHASTRYILLWQPADGCQWSFWLMWKLSKQNWHDLKNASRIWSNRICEGQPKAKLSSLVYQLLSRRRQEMLERDFMSRKWHPPGFHDISCALHFLNDSQRDV